MKKLLDTFADWLTGFIGSWYFIILFFICMFTWMGLQPFIKIDPFPYILLNLVLSTLAAVQGAIIMISQRKQEEKDRQKMQEIHRMVKSCERYVAKMIDNSERE